MKVRFTALLFLSISWGIGLGASNSLAICPAAYQNILVDQFSAMMQDKDFILINVHTPYQGEIPRTDLLIPHDQIESRQSELPADKKAKIVVYGLTGPKGYAAAQRLFELGYTNIIHFNGGMQAWTQNGHPLNYRDRQP